MQNVPSLCAAAAFFGRARFEYGGRDGTNSLATQGYGVANWYFVNGEVDKAREILDKVLAGKYCSAFGCIAAKADVNRMEEGS